MASRGTTHEKDQDGTRQACDVISIPGAYGQTTFCTTQRTTDSNGMSNVNSTTSSIHLILTCVKNNNRFRAPKQAPPTTNNNNNETTTISRSKTYDQRNHKIASHGGSPQRGCEFIYLSIVFRSSVAPPGRSRCLLAGFLFLLLFFFLFFFIAIFFVVVHLAQSIQLCRGATRKEECHTTRTRDCT